MTFKAHLGQERAFRTVVVLLAYLVCRVICETGDCRQQEYRDGSGNCVLCKQCGPGMELSKECGFGYGEDARCLTCRPHRFKEDWGFQKCKPCLECAVVNRFQKANCSVTSDAVCGDCLPGFYRKTKLVGFQDMECVPCGDPPPPYEPHSYCRTNAVADFLDYCNAANFEGEFDPPGKNKEVCVSPAPSNPCASTCGHSNVTPSVASCPHLHRHQGWKETQKCRCPRTSKVNLVKIPSTASSPRDTALAAVICSALATVLLALLVLCVIYCKRQFMEKKPSWSLRAQDIQYNGSELSCFDRPQLNGSAPRPCCKCHRDSAQTCGPVHLIPSLCCDEACSIDRVTLGCRVHSKTTLQERSICGEFSDAWPLMQNPVCGDDISFCDSDPELTGEDVHPLSPENHCSFSSDSDSRQDSVGGALPIQARPENLTDAADFSRPHSSLTESVLTQATLPARRQLHQESGDMTGLTAQTSLQEKNTDGTQQALTPPLGLMD